MLILLSLHSSLRLSPSVMADTTLQPPTSSSSKVSLLQVSTQARAPNYFFWMRVDIYHSVISSFTLNDAICLPLIRSIYFSTATFFLYSFFFWYFSLSLQTDIHASLHMGFNLPLSPKIFLAQAWDKGIITSKGSWGGDCPLPPSWKEKWTIR